MGELPPLLSKKKNIAVVGKISKESEWYLLIGAFKPDRIPAMGYTDYYMV
jgi:hypothetical protein